MWRIDACIAAPQQNILELRWRKCVPLFPSESPLLGCVPVELGGWRSTTWAGDLSVAADAFPASGRPLLSKVLDDTFGPPEVDFVGSEPAEGSMGHHSVVLADVIQTSLKELLAQHAKSTQEQLEDTKKQNADFQRDVREAVQRLETRRREEQRSNRGGEVFEESVAEFIQNRLGGYGYIVEPTGNVVGLRPNCKVGDVVIQFPTDHAFAGCRIVVEAKRDKSYTVSNALEELATARKNRNAAAGIFILARSHASPGFQTFARYGQDVVVIWDDENPSTDPYLQAALMVGLALATRTKSGADEGDMRALQEVEQRLVKELERLDKIRRSAETIRKQAETIEKEVGVGEQKIGRILDDAKKTLVALNIELRDEEVEQRSPIAMGVVDCGVATGKEVALAAGAGE